MVNALGTPHQVKQQADELQASEMATQSVAMEAKQRVEEAKVAARQAKEQVRGLESLHFA